MDTGVSRVGRRPTGLVGAAAVLVVALVASLALVGWAAARRSAAGDLTKPDHRYVQDAVDAGTVCIQTVFSYDHRNFDESISAGLDCATGELRDQYRSTVATLQDKVSEERTTVTATVRAVGVVEADPHEVTVLAFLDQERRSRDGAAVDEVRVTATLVPVDGRWLITKAVGL